MDLGQNISSILYSQQFSAAVCASGRISLDLLNFKVKYANNLPIPGIFRVALCRALIRANVKRLMSGYHGLWYQCVASSSAACQSSMLCQRETEMWYKVNLNTSVTPSDSTGKED